MTLRVKRALFPETGNGYRMIIGVTGSMATGTSTTAGYIAKALKSGFLSADKIARIQLTKNSSLKARLIKYFGKDITAPGNTINRKILADKAFSSKAMHKKLCEITHPFILDSMNCGIKRLFTQGFKSIVIDAPMLIESGFYKKCDYIIVVIASLTLQLQRSNENHITNKDALSRINLQMPLCKKAEYADYIIDNSGNLRELKSRCNKISETLKSKKMITLKR
jgi:dephospho-CoA kinase